MNTIETKIQDFLVSRGIYPFSVLYIKSPGLLKISFHLPTDIPEFLDLFEVEKICDNFGFKEFQQDNTILLSGQVFLKILRDAGCTENY